MILHPVVLTFLALMAMPPCGRGRRSVNGMMPNRCALGLGTQVALARTALLVVFLTVARFVLGLVISEQKYEYYNEIRNTFILLEIIHTSDNFLRTLSSLTKHI